MGEYEWFWESDNHTITEDGRYVYKKKKFELCPPDTGAILYDIYFGTNWKDAKKHFAMKGYRGKHLILEGYDDNGNTIVHRVTING